MIIVEQDIKPLSINKAFQGRRFKTKQYQDFEALCLYSMPKYQQIRNFVSIDIIFYFKNNRSDIDNCIKPILDIIVKKGYIEDDRKIMKLTVQKRITKGKEGFGFRINEI